MTSKRFLCVLAVAPIAALSFAQATFDQKVVNLALIRIPAVNKDLKIAADQTRRMAAAEKQSGADLDKLQKAKQPPTQAQLQFVAKASRERLVAILSPSQLKRLREITLQTLGPLGVMNPDIQAKLNISKTQKPKLAAVWKSYAPKLAEAATPKDPKKKQTDADLKKRMAAIDKIQKELAGAVRDILTPDQLKLYRSLVGKPCPGLQVAARVPL
jgi:hypothetical protein